MEGGMGSVGRRKEEGNRNCRAQEGQSRCRMWIFESLFRIKELEAYKGWDAKEHHLLLGVGKANSAASMQRTAQLYWHIMTFQICAQILHGPLGRIKCSLSAEVSIFSPDGSLEAYLKHLLTGAGLIISHLSV